MASQALITRIENAINAENAEAESDTPDFILAEYVGNCLDALDLAVNRREVFLGRPEKEQTETK